MVKKYVKLTVSKGFTGTNLALNGSNITLGVASKIYDISKEEKAHKKDIPISFKDFNEFQKSIDIYKNVSYIKEFATDNPIIGVRESSAYGLSPNKGMPFSKNSDIDVFIVSDKLFNEGVKRLETSGIQKLKGAYVRKEGYLTEDALKKVFPEFKTADEEVSKILGRKSGIRIMTKEQYESIKTGKEILGE